ncbi:chromosomal replication initiator protein DnaA [Candidatus Microgenomates bacterium]|nr:chromosomal replication initiator protein DnaA [Candidatus Microgenomates bacterium]
MNVEQIWSACLGELEVLLSRANFNTWFKGTKIAGVGNDNIVISTPNSFTKEWLEKKYQPQICEVLSKRIPGIKSVSFAVLSQAQILKNNVSIETREDIQEGDFATNDKEIDGLNPKYTFNTFVIGESNRLAHAAATAVSKTPGTTYNPLFIYGGVGLGKTHLMHAIGNEISKKDKKKNIVYTTCEKFTNEFISLIRKGKGEKFKNSYRSVDVLMIDDIQFLANKESTQEEFFHTFNALHSKNKQIVITSDRPPKAIPSLESRLVSRFEWGMIADINPPDYETRLAILQKKALEKERPVNNEILGHIAKSIQNNIRELEGALNRVMAYAELNNSEPKMEDIKQILGEPIINGRQRILNPKDLLKKVSEHYEVSIEQLMGSRRNKELVYPRQISAYLLREELAMSFPRIGKELGGKDHTTIIHACNKIAKEIRSSDIIKHEINIIKEKLYSL